ncbi:bromo adjacent homology (BAH) domain protein [Artemisia annua]|uniref:Cytosine-specific methyltransferase n=1 Tax=Artemisia annua TaxID=35608 RepID=A0A2U1P4S7_ARTAN|nr:bromo adjacent homology (BAH) domain protein [Artemisia annua]
MVADNGEAPTSQPPPLPPLPPPPSPSPSQPTPPTQPTPQLHSLRRRSPRLVECGYSVEGGSDKAPAKKKAKITTSLVGVEFNDGGERVSFLIGDPVSDEEARRRWPLRYDIEGLKRKGRYPTTKINSEDDDDELILNVKCHYLQAKISTHVFDLGDCAIVKGEEEGHDHVGRILEFFKTNTDEEYFRVQWFFRAEDTVIKDAATSNDKKRVFYSTLMNDNPLDCIVSKVKILKVAPGINLKSIPKCDFYYDMEYNINYSTFSTIKDDVSSNNCCVSSSDKKEEIHSNGSIGKEEIHSNGSIGKEEIHSNGSIGKEEIHSNGSIGTSINGSLTRCKSHKSELTLLDLYSGCGGMSTGLCFGAKLSGVDLSTKWAVDANKCACESLRLNHPETQIRNEYAEDFLDLIKEWDKLCKKYKVKAEKTDSHDPMFAGSQDDVTPSKADSIATKDEYEVEKLVDICYSDLDGTNKRELKFKVRWAGYGPSDDTWEPIQGLRKCQDKIREFVHKGCKAKILPRPGDVDIICGGPPCQGISGHNRHRNFESPLEDERNYQIVVFMEIISFLKPRYVLMENVGDILRYANGSLARYAISCLVREYYQVRLGIMAAGCYGLPQYRLRVFLWGAHHDEHLPPFPLPTHDVVFKYGSPTGFERNVVAYDKGKLQNIEKCVLLKDAISDLPPVSNSESRDEMNYTNAPETEFQKFIRASKSDMLGNASLSSCDKKKPLLYDHRPFSLNEDDCLRVSRVPKRKGASFRDLPGILFGDDNVVIRAPEPELMPSGKHWVPNYAINFNDGKNMKSFARVWWDETVSTVLCAPNYRTEAIIHPEQDRVLTIRECARLQGFPDFYALCGTVKERYRQVGNAVAVPVGRALGYTLGMALQKMSGEEPLVTLPPKFAHSTTIDLLQPSLAIEP